MLKKALIASLICLGGLFSSSAAPTLGGPTLSATGGSTNSSSGGVDTNAVIALIEQYGGGGVVSNTIVQLIERIWYTNGQYPLVVEAQIELPNSSALMLFSVKDTNSAVIGYLPGSAEWNEFGNASKYAFATTTATEDNVQSLGGYVPAYAAFRYYASGTTASIYDNAPNGTRLVYFGSGDGTNSSSGGGVSAVEVELAIRQTIQTNQSVFNIIDYGALTNAHKALQICLDKAGTNNGGGGVCFIPAGNWYITNSSFYPTLSSENLESMLVIIGTNVTVKGVGPASKIIVDLGTLASRNVFGSGDSIASGGGRVNWQGTYNATFMDFTLDSQQNGGDQTQFYGGHTFKFINMRSLNSGADFIDTESVNTTAINCYVSNAIGSAFQTKASTSATAQGIIVGCDFVDNSSAASAPTIQVLNNVSIACDNVDIGGPKNLYSVGVFAGGQFSFNNCYFYPTNGGQAPIIIAGAVGSFSDCTFYGAGSTTSSNYIYFTNSTVSVINGVFYSKDAIWANDSKLTVSMCKLANSVSAGITMRGTASLAWGSKIALTDFLGGSATAIDSSVSFARIENNTSVDRNILITGGTNSIVANNTMMGTASTRITSAQFNEIRDNIMPVNSGSVHSIFLTSANSNTIAGNKFGKLTFSGVCYGNEFADNRFELLNYIGGSGAVAGNTWLTGNRLRNMTWTNTFWDSSFSDGSSYTNIQATNIVGTASRVLGFDASGIGTNIPTTGSGMVVLSNTPTITSPTILNSMLVTNSTSTTSSPLLMGATPNYVGSATRLHASLTEYLQASAGSRFNIGAYWGITIRGNRQSSTPESFVNGGATDPSLLVVGTQTATPVIRIQSASGQSTNAFEVVNSSGNVLASIHASGGFQISSNALSTWPTAPQTSGACYFGNSNGVIYLLTSVGNTWTATNKIAP